MEKIESQISKDKSLVDRIRELSGVVILSKCEYERLVQKQASEDTVKTLERSISVLNNQLDSCRADIEYWRNKYNECRNELKKRCNKWWKF